MPHDTLLLLIRHGAVAGGDEVLWGRREARLNGEGRRSVAALADALASARVQLGTVVASPRARTVESADVLARALGRPRVTDAGFDEFDYGNWSGRPFTSLAAKPEWQAFNESRRDERCAPRGESVAAFRSRVRRALDVRLGAFPAPLGIVTHAEVIRAIVLESMGRTLEDWRFVHIPPASLTILRAGCRPPVLIACGLTGRLVAAGLAAGRALRQPGF